ncbi:nucleoside-diphosphate sugar epimerase/dehydratase [Anabaena sp. UHCC 0451]|uniref:polysaccharide biosynthesis protein n=1 Tax=Anabaena sp. UHCC 0451 TaxID=2055235 RepID=UPI002B1EA962|nr:nucleoside-diphosphate sugar epimerase/dehydratase [Anabaena sp. UHCC 0451]MEA5579042.1 nucleoside-diphosphate sugar epimerase/dehydratase [Anabaena sp. UHCC 0451]
MNIPFLIFDNTIQKISSYLLSKLIKIRNRHWVIFDIFVFMTAPFLGLFLRLDGNLNLQEYILGLGIATIVFLGVKLIVLCCCGFYRRYWRYASVEELTYIVMLMITAILIQTLVFNFLDIFDQKSNLGLDKLPNSLPIIEGLLSCICVIALRFSHRILERINQKQAILTAKEKVLIVGAGNAGLSLAEDIQRNPQFGVYPVAFIDDNPRKLHIHLRGIPVMGNRYQIPELVESLKINKIVIAIPSVSGEVIRKIVHICKTTGIKTSTLPGIHEIINDCVRLNSIRDVRIEDLLRRKPIQIDIDKVAKFLNSKTVVITGSGGSIGSELCRQILQSHPSKIVLIGHGENSIFNIQQELENLITNLQHSHKPLPNIPIISAFIADIRIRLRLEQAFEQFKPDIIFHAAAHKHVPLMELNPAEAITNNVIGTKNLLEVAKQYGVKHFVMISTDKAVNPTNIMGASKRVAEMLVLQAAIETENHYVAVRFGNVLGSRGSVVPTFKKQIESGGPVTVTHPDITRYFMTIPEAVQLVLQASVLGRSGEILMLNMGEPVKIVDLAKELIQLSGYEPNKDIDIVFTGLRPGEKLFEELFVEGEEYEKTEYEKLLIVKNASRIIPSYLDISVEKLLAAATNNDTDSIMSLLSQLVSGYKPKFSTANPEINALNINTDTHQYSSSNIGVSVVNG